jgi:fructose/tagatose bisphosphate aldolase
MHIVTKGKPAVDLEALRKIAAAVDLPLVVHGGTGFPPDSIADAIRLGVAKFNFGTGLKQAYLAAVQKKLAAYREPMNPHPFLGMGGDQDILVGGREAVKAIVKQLLSLCGSAGKAPGK